MAAEFELYQSGTQWAFRLRGNNNETLLSSERYTARAGAENGIQSVRANAPLDEQYNRKTSVLGQPYFVLRAANNQILGTSEMYTSTQAMETGIAAVKRVAPGAPVRT